jgi:NAD dependent epimerase/dehydratase family enzyme
VLGRVTVLPLPTFMVKLLFGEMGDELLLTSCRAEPAELNRAGFSFKYPDLEQALNYLISEENPSNPKSSILSI